MYTVGFLIFVYDRILLCPPQCKVKRDATDLVNAADTSVYSIPLQLCIAHCSEVHTRVRLASCKSRTTNLRIEAHLVAQAADAADVNGDLVSRLEEGLWIHKKAHATWRARH